jgi:hypothetical protein
MQEVTAVLPVPAVPPETLPNLDTTGLLGYMQEWLGVKSDIYRGFWAKPWEGKM